MPGRRKRRRSRKKSLVFTESPINNQKHLPTPVHCVDNPITAKIVPVEEDSLWVSPQFRDILSSKREARYVRRCHSTIVTRSRNPSNKENTTLHHKSQYRNKYKSLNFLGDDSIESEDISFSSPSPISKRVHSVVYNKSLHKTPESNGQGISWSLEKLKRSKKTFEISFSESLNVSTPTMPHMNHTLNIPVDTQSQVVPCVDIPHQNMETPEKMELLPRNNKDVLNDIENSTPRRRSTRLKAKYLQAFELFRTPPPDRHNYGHILVKDTPECDYNLSVRARQLRGTQTKIVGVT